MCIRKRGRKCFSEGHCGWEEVLGRRGPAESPDRKGEEEALGRVISRDKESSTRGQAGRERDQRVAVANVPCRTRNSRQNIPRGGEGNRVEGPTGKKNDWELSIGGADEMEKGVLSDIRRKKKSRSKNQKKKGTIFTRPEHRAEMQGKKTPGEDLDVVAGAQEKAWEATVRKLQKGQIWEKNSFAG